MVPTTGAAGVVGGERIITLADDSDIQLFTLVTVKVYELEASPEIVVLVPVPVKDPGLIVQVPEAGNPFNTTLPVARAHVG